MITKDLIQELGRCSQEAIEYLQRIVDILRERPVEADFFRGMINRIKSERKRICRQIAREDPK